MMKTNQSGGLTPQQQHVLRIAIDYVRWKQAKQQQLLQQQQHQQQQHQQHQQQQQHAAMAAAAAARPPPTTASEVPPQLPKTQQPAPQVAQQPHLTPQQQQLLQQRQQLSNLASPTLQKKVKKEPEPQKQAPRASSQAEVRPPSQPAAAAKPPPMKQEPGQAAPGNQPAHMLSIEQLAQRQQLVFDQLIQMHREEQRAPHLRQPVELTPQERNDLKANLSNQQTKSLVRRVEQLIPMFMLLGGDVASARELIRAVIPPPSTRSPIPTP